MKDFKQLIVDLEDAHYACLRQMEKEQAAEELPFRKEFNNAVAPIRDRYKTLINESWAKFDKQLEELHNEQAKQDHTQRHIDFLTQNGYTVTKT